MVTGLVAGNSLSFSVVQLSKVVFLVCENVIF
jgi:hypothetical protein